VAGDGEFLGDPLTFFAMRFLALALVVGCGSATTPKPVATGIVSLAQLDPSKPVFTTRVIVAHGCTIDDDNGYTDDWLRVPLGVQVNLQILNVKPPGSATEVAIGTTTRSMSSRATDSIEFVVESAGQYTWWCDGKQLPLSVEDPARLNAAIQHAHDATHPTTLDGRIALGHKLYENKGCVQCHTIDGTPRVGPSWKGIWGSTVTAGDGATRTVDAAYVRESIMTPQAFVVATFPPVMPTFGGALKDHEIDALTAFIESLK
jgi:cytochrome c551/c552